MPNKIAKEVAEKEFEKLCSARRISTDVSEFNDKEKAQFEARKRDILRLMMAGSLVLNKEGNPVFTPPVEGAAPITFHQATGATLMAGDGAKGPAEQMVQIGTEMTKLPPGELSKLHIADFRAVDDIVTFLLAQ